MKRIIALLALTLACPAQAQCDDWRAGPTQNSQTDNGANGIVYSLTSWDPTGSGQQYLAAGGSFTRMQDATVQNFAVLDPVNGQWGPLGDSDTSTLFASEVHALSTFGGTLVVGTGTDPINGQGNGYGLHWNGAHWNTLDSQCNLPDFTNMTPLVIKCFGVFQSHLFCGGDLIAWIFPQPNGCGGQYGWGFTQWDGSAHLFSPGGTAQADVLAMAPFGSHLIVGGTFNFGQCSCEPGDYIAAWDGANWSQLADGLNGSVQALAVFQGQLYVGGSFTQTVSTGAPITLNHIARWDGSAWHALGSGFNGPVTSLAVYQNSLIIGGNFTTSGLAFLDHIARWDGSALHGLAAGTNNTVNCLTTWNNMLVAGGAFTTADGQPANHIARWDGSQWSSFGGGTVNSLYAFTPFGFTGSRIVAAGSFQQSTQFDQAANNIASWNGLYLSALGTGMDAPVHALKSFNTTAGVNTTFHLVAGGEFTNAGGAAASRIAEWSEPSTAQINPPVWVPLGNGFNDTVYALERFNNIIYAAGAFTASGSTSLARIAQWNGTSWAAVGTGLNGTCNALKVYNGQLYAGGSFTTAGGLSSGGLARWNGTAWSIVGGPFTGTVYALEVFGSDLIIGGSFPGVAGSPNVASYNSVTNSYSALGSGGADSAVRALLSENGNLYVAGDFTHAGGVAAAHLARWDGSAWSSVRGGADDTIFALAGFNHEVHAGGVFQNVRTAAIPAAGWARYLETGAPWVVFGPQSTSGQCNHEVSFSGHAAVGYSVNYTWRHNGVPLADGPTGTGSIIAGAGNSVIDILNIGLADSGTYDLVLSNACGSATSFPATLTVTGCCGSADFNCDGDLGTDADIESFFACLAGNCPAPPCYNSADFNGDGDLGTDADIEAFFRVLAGGNC